MGGKVHNPKPVYPHEQRSEKELWKDIKEKRAKNKEEVKDEITVIIKDSKGKTFSRDWKNTADKRNAIRWTLEHGDLPYYVDIAEIVEIKIN